MLRTIATLTAGLLLSTAALADDEARTFDSRGEYLRGNLEDGVRGRDLALAVEAEWEARKGVDAHEQDRRSSKLAAKATAKHKGRPSGAPRG